MKNIFIIAVLFISSIGHAQQEDIKIFAPGKTSLAIFESRKAEIEQKTGRKIQLFSPNPEASITALVKGTADCATLGRDVEEALKAVEKSGIKANPADYQWVNISDKKTRVLLHPDNAVKSLSKQEISDIVSGKTKTWTDVAGKQVPITMYAASNYKGTLTSVVKTYGGAVGNFKMTVDNAGIFRALQRDPGGMAFMSQDESVPNFKPKAFDTDIAVNTFLVAKKPARPEVQALLDYLKK